MANAKKDQNGRSTIIAVSSVNGQTMVQPYVNPITHRLKITTVVVGDGGDNNGNAMIDENGTPAWTALSSYNDGSIIEIYANPLTNAIII